MTRKYAFDTRNEKDAVKRYENYLKVFMLAARDR